MLCAVGVLALCVWCVCGSVPDFVPLLISAGIAAGTVAAAAKSAEARRPAEQRPRLLGFRMLGGCLSLCRRRSPRLLQVVGLAVPVVASGRSRRLEGLRAFGGCRWRCRCCLWCSPRLRWKYARAACALFGSAGSAAAASDLLAAAGSAPALIRLVCAGAGLLCLCSVRVVSAVVGCGVVLLAPCSALGGLLVGRAACLRCCAAVGRAFGARCGWWYWLPRFFACRRLLSPR